MLGLVVYTRASASLVPGSNPRLNLCFIIVHLTFFFKVYYYRKFKNQSAYSYKYAVTR